MVYEWLTMPGLLEIQRYATLGAAVALLAGMFAAWSAYADALNNAYLGYFFDKITFLAGCL